MPEKEEVTGDQAVGFDSSRLAQRFLDRRGRNVTHPRPHPLRQHEEDFYVLEGEPTVRVGPQELHELLLTLDTIVASICRHWHHDCGVGSSL